MVTEGGLLHLVLGRHDPYTEACFTGTVLTALVLYKHYESCDTAAGAELHSDLISHTVS